VVWTGNTDKFTIWENEIFNRSVGTIYRTGAPLPGDLAETPVTVSRTTGDLLSAGRRPVRARYALADGTLGLRGQIIGEDPRTGLALYRIQGSLQQASRVEGLWPQDTWSHRTITYSRFDCTGGTLAVRLQSDPHLFKAPNAVLATESGVEVGRVTVPTIGTSLLRVPLHSTGGRCVVRFTVSRTAVPVLATNGQNADTRVLGVHFNSFGYRPSRRA
jgi:hypothetical protein